MRTLVLAVLLFGCSQPGLAIKHCDRDMAEAVCGWCNDWGCNEDDTVTCTLLACPPKPLDAGP